jgi:hypothetical protein
MGASVEETLRLREQIEATNQFPSDISLSQVKLFIDGTVEDRTAALETDYSCCVPGRGAPFADEDTVKQVIVAFDAGGVAVSHGSHSAHWGFDDFRQRFPSDISRSAPRNSNGCDPARPRPSRSAAVAT